MARVVFEVSTNAVRAEVFVLVRERAERLALEDGCGAADLPEGNHALVWKFDGPPNARFTARATQAGVTLFEASSYIAPCELAGAGSRRFSVKGREALRLLKRGGAEVIDALFPAPTVLQPGFAAAAE